MRAVSVNCKPRRPGSPPVLNRRARKSSPPTRRSWLPTPVSTLTRAQHTCRPGYANCWMRDTRARAIADRCQVILAVSGAIELQTIQSRTLELSQAFTPLLSSSNLFAKKNPLKSQFRLATSGALGRPRVNRPAGCVAGHVSCPGQSVNGGCVGSGR